MCRPSRRVEIGEIQNAGVKTGCPPVFGESGQQIGVQVESLLGGILGAKQMFVHLLAQARGLSIPVQPQPVIFIDDRGVAGPLTFSGGSFSRSAISKKCGPFEVVIDEFVRMDLVRIVGGWRTVVAVVPWAIRQIRARTAGITCRPETAMWSHWRHPKARGWGGSGCRAKFLVCASISSSFQTLWWKGSRSSQTGNSYWSRNPASSAISSQRCGAGPMQIRNVFHCMRFGISTRNLRTQASSQGKWPEAGSAKNRCSVMLAPRR